VFASVFFLIACLIAAIPALIAIQVFLATNVADSLSAGTGRDGAERTFVGLSADRYARLA
jgi:hypothetical protein